MGAAATRATGQARGALESKTGLYRARWKLPGWTSEKTGGTHKKQSAAVREAVAKLQEAQDEAEKQTEQRKRFGEPMTLAEWLLVWTEMRAVSPQQKDFDRTVFARFHLPAFGEYLLTEITRLEGITHRRGLEARYSQGYADKAFGVLNTCLNDAVEAQVLDYNPLNRIRKGSKALARDVWLTREDFERVLAEVDPWYLPVLIGYLSTGLRSGELCGLHQAQVDRDARRLQINQVLRRPQSGGRQTIKWTAKGGTVRTVPLGQRLLEVLPPDEHTGAGCGLVHVDNLGKPLRQPPCTDDLVFTGPRGRPLNPGNLGQRQWATALTKAGVAHVRLHDLRHTFATHFSQDGGRREHLQQLLGHTTPAMTDRYTNDREVALKAGEEIVNSPAALEAAEKAARQAARNRLRIAR